MSKNNNAIAFDTYVGNLSAGQAEFICLADTDMNIRAVYSGAVHASYVEYDLDRIKNDHTDRVPNVDSDGNIIHKGTLLTHGPTLSSEHPMAAWESIWSAESVQFFKDSLGFMTKRVEVPVSKLRVPLSVYKTVLDQRIDCETTPVILQLGKRLKGEAGKKSSRSFVVWSINDQGRKDKIIHRYEQLMILDSLYELTEGGQVFPSAGALLHFAMEFCASRLKTTSSHSDEYLSKWLCWPTQEGRDELAGMLSYTQEFVKALRKGSLRGVNQNTRGTRRGFVLGQDSGNSKLLDQIRIAASK